MLKTEVIGKDDTSLRCRVTSPGLLGSRRHINLPGVDVNLPSLTEKDERDIRVGVAVISYLGELHFGYTGDYDTTADLDVLRLGVAAGLAELLAAAAESSPESVPNSAAESVLDEAAPESAGPKAPAGP